jgi:hypothetical protein
VLGRKKEIYKGGQNMTTQTNHPKLPILSFLGVLCLSAIALARAEGLCGMKKRNEPKVTGPAGHPEWSEGSHCAKQTQFPHFQPKNKEQSKIKANFLLWTLVSRLWTRNTKQSVRQAKLVQSSRFQSCPVKGSLQAGI